ncbi:MAG TPA: bifunctional alpha,alpha-trehalose-phosphate synthase (UDP-forming)/trehalose-phosphatase [Candidatus Jacksonbacteria bacterium]|nr:bifunctional alpha,alpha-trehalose-phosphate synthase (UDP-forming)/trehalose-phosphatase [Candidatus Jacksonbacteria bacterium]
MSERLVIISNRLPLNFSRQDGKIKFTKSVGGLATGLSSYLASLRANVPQAKYLWVGWPGLPGDNLEVKGLEVSLHAKKMHPVMISAEEIKHFYNGFCNDTVWPLFHSFPYLVSYNNEEWAAYRAVNERFCEEALKVLQPDDIVWIHDYHLMLLPKMLRERLPDLAIGFFLHIPFPVFEIFRLLPNKWRRQILQGMLGSDLIGFHTYDYSRHFIECVGRILGYEHSLGIITTENRATKVDTFPMGIDFFKFYEGANRRAVQREQAKLKKIEGVEKIILSVDRLDYTKGIINRLQGYQTFLTEYPEWREKVQFILVVVPSRMEVKLYNDMKSEIDGLVGEINGFFGTVNWTPVNYRFKALSFAELSALYSMSNIALVTPLRDGMNLIAKEYVASRQDQSGVLILSEMAGAAQELGEAIIINPHHRDEMVEAIVAGLNMPLPEQQERMNFMQRRLQGYTVTRWVEDFIHELTDFKATQRESKLLNAKMRRQISLDFHQAKLKFLFLDYDGTLVPIKKTPQYAEPDTALLSLLDTLSKQPRTRLVIISGRDKNTMERWFRGLDLDLVAEHGIWIREGSASWEIIKPLQNDWKKEVLPILKKYTERLPGSFIEEKEFSIAWHYRLANFGLASMRAKELINNLNHLLAKHDVQVIQGKRVVEVRSFGANKGTVATYYLEKYVPDFILAIGDDTTDEDLFKAIGDRAYTIKVGYSKSHAQYIVESHNDVRFLLESLLENVQE